MKEMYEIANCEIVVFETADVITASAPENAGHGGGVLSFGSDLQRQ